MIYLEVDKTVLQQMKVAFPSPPNAAENALKKYVKVLEEALLGCLIRGRDPWDHKFDLYTLSLHNISQKCPRISTKKIRLNTWLDENSFALITTVNLGSNYSKQNSKVKLSRLVTLTVDLNPLDPETMFEYLHQNHASWNAVIIQNDYECFQVDFFSLQNYIHQLCPKNKPPRSRVEATALFQAKCIYAAAKFANGTFYQKKKLSFFGRTYYEKLSVQNVNKELRRAMLGDSWEYDIRSSVVTWKLGFAQDCINHFQLNGTVQSIFPCCYQYSLQKSVLINQIIPGVFPLNVYTPDKQNKLIKSAMTALNFGARLSNISYIDKFGELQQGALNEVFKFQEDVEAFLQCQLVKDFVDEQKVLDGFILEVMGRTQPHIFTLSELHNKKGKPKPQAILAYLYQHAEYDVMSIVRGIAQQHNLVILANIHDAIVFKDQLPASLKSQMESAIKSTTNNPFWHLEEKQQLGF